MSQMYPTESRLINAFLCTKGNDVASQLCLRFGSVPRIQNYIAIMFMAFLIIFRPKSLDYLNQIVLQEMLYSLHKLGQTSAKLTLILTKRHSL